MNILTPWNKQKIVLNNNFRHNNLILILCFKKLIALKVWILINALKNYFKKFLIYKNKISQKVN